MHHTGEELERLDLSDNPMTEEVAPALAEALRKQARLVRLNLNDTSLQDEGVQAIAEVLCPITGICVNAIFPPWKEDTCVTVCTGSFVILRDGEVAKGKGGALTHALWGLMADLIILAFS